MLNPNEILNESNNLLRQKSEIVSFPLEDEDKKLIENMMGYLRKSQDEEYAEKNKLRAGMGLAFVQLGKRKQIFTISYKNDDGSFEEYVVINPKIVSNSEELVYVKEGEGCLSVNRSVEGIIPRYARVTVEYYDIDGKKETTRVREEIAVAFQHEIDHLNGILFVDRIDKKNPFKNMDNMREI